MFLSTRSVGGVGFAAGLAALLLAATTALAEIENTVSGNVRQQVVPAPQPVLRLVPVPVPYQVTVHVETPPSEQVTIRGPDGEVRSFTLVGGRQAIRVRQEAIVLRPGQQVTVTCVPAAPGR